MIHYPSVRLRHFNQNDLQNVFAGLSDPQVVQYYGVSYSTIEECAEQISWFRSIRRYGIGLWLAVENRADSAFIGAIGVNNFHHVHRCAELGYWLLPKYWGQGKMFEIMTLFIPYIYQEFPLNRLLATVEEPNHRSARLLEKCHFTYEGISRECEFKDGRFISLKNYSLLRSEIDWFIKS